MFWKWFTWGFRCLKSASYSPSSSGYDRPIYFVDFLQPELEQIACPRIGADLFSFPDSYLAYLIYIQLPIVLQVPLYFLI